MFQPTHPTASAYHLNEWLDYQEKHHPKDFHPARKRVLLIKYAEQCIREVNELQDPMHVHNDKTDGF